MRGILAMVLISAVGSTAALGQQPSETAAANQTADNGAQKQLYEVRRYVLGDAGDGEALDRYLSDVLLPALERSGAGPVGLFAPAEGAEASDRFAIITYDSISQIPQVRTKLTNDQEFLAKTEQFEAGGPDDPPYARIHSELLLAMDVMPKLDTEKSLSAPDSRVYELRIYESATERLGERKVQMFNEGEVPIFLKSGINPVFLGQAILGPYTPSLTYMTVYDDDEARQQAWKTFVDHPEWKELSGQQRYQGTVSKIYKFVLRPLPKSQM